MSEYINKILVETPDGSSKELRVGGSEPVVEHKYGQDYSQAIKEAYVYGDTSFFSGDMRISFDSSKTTLFLPIGMEVTAITEENYPGLYIFKFPFGNLYIYADTPYNNFGNFRIISMDRSKNLGSSPTIAAYLAMQKESNKLKMLQEVTINKVLNDQLPTMVYRNSGDTSYVVDYDTHLSDDAKRFTNDADVEEIVMLDCSNVTSLKYVFGATDAWGNTNKIRPLSRIQGMYNMDSLAARGFDMVFCGLHNLKEVVFNTSSLGAANGMQATFNDCQSLETIDMSKLDFSKMIHWTQTFGNCKKLTTLKLPKAEITKVNWPQAMFYYCESLTKIDLTNITCKVGTWGYQHFAYCTKLETLDMSTWDFSEATNNNSKGTFLYCGNLTNFSGFPNMPLSYSLLYSSKLTYESVMNCINGLYDLTEGGTVTDYTPQTLTMSSTSKSKLSDEDVAIATAKGWNIA